MYIKFSLFILDEITSFLFGFSIICKASYSTRKILLGIVYINTICAYTKIIVSLFYTGSDNQSETTSLRKFFRIHHEILYINTIGAYSKIRINFD